MAANIENVGAKYPFAFRDAKGEFMFGGNNYKVNLPKDIPVAGDTARAATSGEESFMASSGPRTHELRCRLANQCLEFGFFPN